MVTNTHFVRGWLRTVRIMAKMICPTWKCSVSLGLVFGLRVISFVRCYFSSQEHVERIREDFRAELRNEGTSLQMRTTTFYYFNVLHFELGASSRRAKKG